MTKIKLCGMMRPQDIEAANVLLPEFVGFVFAPDSKRYVPFDVAKRLRAGLAAAITPVGVFADAPVETVAALIEGNIIGVAQLHGSENNDYIRRLRSRVTCPVIQAFCIKSEADVARAQASAADYVLLDSGGGTGKCFDHELIKHIRREFFLAGGLGSENVRRAIQTCRPYGVDASSSLETDGAKDKTKMTAFVDAVRYGKDEER